MGSFVQSDLPAGETDSLVSSDIEGYHCFCCSPVMSEFLCSKYTCKIIIESRNDRKYRI